MMHRYFILTTIFLLGFLGSCTRNPVEISGKGTGAETPNTISGTVIQEDGEPAKGAYVTLRSKNYVAGLDSNLSKLITLNDTTDIDGKYSFIVEDTGEYIIEIYIDSLEGVRIPIIKNDDDYLVVDTLIPVPVGNLNGTVVFAAGNPKLALVQLLGSEREAKVDTETGIFMFDNISPGKFTLRIIGGTPLDTIETEVLIESGKIYSFISDTLGIPLNGSLSGFIQLPGNTRGKISITLNDTTEIILDSSGSFSFPKLPKGSYALKAWGTVPRRDTIVRIIDLNWNENKELNLSLKKLSILIVDGFSNHDWQQTTKAYLKILEGANLFNIDVSTTPDSLAPLSDWEGWRPEFIHYDAVLVNYNSWKTMDSVTFSWPDPVKMDFEKFVDEGGGVYLSHDAVGMDKDWEAFNQMIGVAYRDTSFGPAWYLDSTESLIEIPTALGPIINGNTNPARIHISQTNHPITNNLPPIWMHLTDELPYYMRGEAKHLTILSYSPIPGTDRFMPTEWITNFGKGKVYTTKYGHVMNNNLTSLKCAGFQTILIRTMEWVASGQITTSIPPDFPTSETTSARNNLNSL